MDDSHRVAAMRPSAELQAFIQTLPRLLWAHPIHILPAAPGAGGPRIGFGPIAPADPAPLHPADPAQLGEQALFTVHGSSQIALPPDLPRWVRAAGIDIAVLIEFDAWPSGRHSWPRWARPATRTLVPERIQAATAAELRTVFWNEWSRPVLEEGLRACVQHLRERAKGRLEPGSRFRFNPTAGTLEPGPALPAQVLPGSSPTPRARTGSGWIRIAAEASLQGVDLTGAALPGVCLAEADLTGAHLAGADLTAANLERSQLAYADLHQACLRSARLDEVGLYSCDLRGADLRGADLTDAELDRASLQGADLRGACIEGLSLAGAITSEQTRWPAGLDLAAAGVLMLAAGGQYDALDLAERSLHGACLAGASLVKSNLMNTRLPQADLSGARLDWASLSETDLSGARLVGASLQRAELSGADLRGADLRQADLRGAGLCGVELTGAQLAGADLSGADLSQVDLRGVDLSKVLLAGVEWDDATRWPEGFTPPRPSDPR